METAKFLTWLFSPLTLGMLGVLSALLCLRRPSRRRLGLWMGAASLLWIMVWSSPLLSGWLGGSLERLYPPARVETVAPADAIVLLGGGLSSPGRATLYPDMSGAADRVWQAARLYHAGKAPLVIASGCAEETAAVPLLRDLGVPASAIRVEGASRNTAENARFTRRLLETLGIRRVILVTSAWHMRRAVWLFRHAGVDVVPAAVDYEATLLREQGDHWSMHALLPTPAVMDQNTRVLKEILGYWTCRFLGIET